MGDATHVSACDARPRAFWWLLIFVLAALPRWATVAQYEAHHPMANHPVIDEASYDSWASQLAAGDWIGDEVFFQEPLYAYSLGAIYSIAGHRPDFVRRVQVILGALTAVLAGVLGARIFGPRAGLAAGLLLALYQPAWLFSALLLKPVFLLFVLTALALALIASRESERAWPYLVVGLLAGLGALLRGNILVMLPFIGLWPLGRLGVAQLQRFLESHS